MPLALVGLAGLACRGPLQVSSTMPLIPADPPDLLEDADLFEQREVATWDVTSSREFSAWKLADLVALPGLAGGRRLRATGPDPRMMRTVSLDAGAVQAIEVKLAVPVSGNSLEIFWAAPDDDYSGARRLRLSTEDALEDGLTYLFKTASHPLWRGRIGHLRLDPGGNAGFEVELLRVRAIARRAVPARLGAALETGLKVEVASDVRNAWLGVPGQPVERQVRVSPGQHLRFACALQSGVDRPVDFRVVAVDGPVDREAFHRRLYPAHAGSWSNADVDLSSFAGRTVLLRFATASVPPLELARGFPVWANPELVNAPVTQAREEPPNVVLIVLDTLRADHLSCYGYGLPTSPRIDAWAASRAALFRHVVVQAPWTLPSHVSLFTGLNPLRHGVNHHGRVRASLELLAETLRKAGYTTGAVTGGAYLRPQFGFAQGFDTFQYWPKELSDEELPAGLQRATAWLEANRQRRFFFFFHTYEVHYPHRRREPYFTRMLSPEARQVAPFDLDMRDHGFGPDLTWLGNYFVVKRAGSSDWVAHLSEGEKARVVARYDSEVAYSDHAVGEILGRIQSLGLRGRTLIVLTSDHGEALGEGDLAGHNYLAEHDLLVPLVVEMPDGRGAGRVIEQQVRSIDIAPTILELARVTAPVKPDGRSLLPLLSGDTGDWPADAWSYAASANRGLALHRSNGLKYLFNDVAWHTLLGRESLYDLRSDPQERNDLATRRSTLRYRREAQQLIDRLHRGLRLRLANNADAALSGTFGGAWADHARIKSNGADCACVSWKPARFRLEPGQEQTLYLENLVPGPLEAQGQLEGTRRRPPARFETRFDRTLLSREDQGQGLVFEEGRWKRRPARPTESLTGLVLWLVGDADEKAAQAPVDSETLDQLRALGYIQH